MELTDLWRGRLTLRRLSVLVRHLPAESATAAALSGEKYPGWTVEAYLLADVYAALTGETHPARQDVTPQTTTAGTPVGKVAAALKAQQRRRERE